MTLYKTYSKAQIARIFGVNRGSIYNWESKGLPVRQPERPGRPAKIDFEAALQWFLDREDMLGTSEEGLKILEQAIRSRREKHYAGK